MSARSGYIVIGVIGAGEASLKQRRLAREVGEEIGRRGAILASGGLGGVMEAACQGAKSAAGTTLGILPGFDRAEANPYVDLAVATGLSHARNLILVRSCDALVAIGGGFGTLSEIAFALKLGKPVVAIDSWEVSEGIFPVSDPKEAVELAFKLVQEGKCRTHSKERGNGGN
ncbi:MAG: TIGR00725 family protein [Thermodesulfobacteriota bacterium]